MPEPKKHFTRAFRDAAVRLTQTRGRTRREIAAALGIGLSPRRNWITARRGRAMEEPPPDRQEGMAAALKLLQRESAVLRQEREILSGYFARRVVGWAVNDQRHKNWRWPRCDELLRCDDQLRPGSIARPSTRPSCTSTAS